MTDTFTLTGRILDKSKAPVARARLVLTGHTAVLRDPETNEVYAPPPRVTTNDEGYLCVAVGADREPAAETGVPLVVGVQYELRGVNVALIGRLVFSDAQATEGTLDIADIIPEPPDADPSWSDALAALDGRVDTLEAHPGGGAVDSVNAQTGVVVLDADDVGADPAGSAAAAQSAATTAAATDATTKANAAQAFAIQRANHTGSQTSATISDLTEAVQDILGAALVGSGVTVTYDDAAGSVTITGGGSTDLEAVRDAIGVALVGVGNIGVAVDDAANTITISTTATVNSTDAALRDRSTHTGTQAISTVTSLQAALDAKANVSNAIVTAGLADGTDQSTVLQAAADALAALGGGRLRLPPGVVVGHVTIAAGVVVEGEGRDATFLKRPATWDGPVVQSTGYTTMVATSGTGTTHDMGIRNLTIDGNRAAGGFTAPIAGTAPATPTASTSTTGGTIAAGTQWYRVAPITAAGVGVASAPVSQVTTGSTSTVTVNWSAVTGATGYVIYGRSFNGTRITAVGAVTTWTDTGALTPLTSVNLQRNANLTAYPAVGLYGWRPVVESVRIMGAPGPGLHCTWYAPSGTPGSGVTMEATLRDVTIENSGTNSFIWAGPHDSVIHNLIAAKPGQAATVTTATTDNVVVEGGGPIRFVTSHAWGQSQYAFSLYGQADLTACQAEGGLTGQVLAACPDIHINGVEVFAPGGASAKGLVLGTSSVTASKVSVSGLSAYGFSSSSGTAVDFTYAGTGISVVGRIDQTTGTPITGTTPTDAYVNLVVNGMAGGRFQVPGFPFETSGAAATAQAYAIQRANHTGTQLASTVSDFSEAVQDAVAGFLTAGTNVTLTYNDGANTLTIDAAGGGGGGVDVETVRDTIGAALLGSGVITVTPNDGADTITISSTATANSSDATLLARANHTGTQTASTISDLAAATNPHPGEAVPSDFGFTHWTFNPILVSASGNMTAGSGFFTKVFVRQAATISSIYVYCGAAGVSLTNVGFALYDAAGTLLSSSVNANGATTTAFQSVGLKQITITPQAVTAPVYVLMWFTGTTTPGLIRQAPSSALLTQLGLSAPNLTIGIAGTGLTTAAPSPMAAQTTATFAPFVALA